MAKTLKEILEVYEPKSPDEKRFKDKHIVVKKKYPQGDDDLFTGAPVKPVNRAKTRHGYDPGQDAAVYEESDLNEKAPPGKKFERMVKHIKKGYEKEGLSDDEKSIAYATAWKAYNKNKKGK